MLKTKIKIKTKLIPIAFVSFLIFCLCFQSAYIGTAIPQILTFQAYGRLFALIICLGYAGLLNRNLFKSKVCILTYVLCGVSMLSTIINGGEIVSCLNTFVPMLLIISILELNKSRRNTLFIVLDTWKWMCVLVTVIDIITEISFPEGLYSTSLYTTYWFLGYKTERFVYIFPMIVMFGYIDLKKRQKLCSDFYMAYIIGIISCYLSGATTCWVTLLFFIALYLILRSLMGKKSSSWKQKLLYRLVDYRVGIILYAVLLVCVLMAENIQFITDITTMLGKDPTFSRRSLIWGVLILEILKKPILGLGYMSSAEYVSMVSYVGGTNAHNMILTILVYSGCIGFLTYVIMFITCLRRANKEYSIIELFLISSVYSFLITGVTSSIMVYSVFGIMHYWLLEYEKGGRKTYAKKTSKKNIFAYK